MEDFMKINVNINFSNMNIVELFQLISHAQYELEKMREFKTININSSGGMNEFIKRQDKLNGRIKTIIEVRAITGKSLTAAKDLVDSIISPQPVLNVVSAPNEMPTLQQVRELVQKNQTIPAAKMYRVITNCGLR